MGERRPHSTGQASSDAQPESPKPRAPLLQGHKIRQLRDDEIVPLLRDLYDQHVELVWCSLGLGGALGRQELWHVWMKGRLVAGEGRMLGEERYERLVGPIRTEWAAKFRELNTELHDRDELETEIRATLDERYQSSAQTRDPLPGREIDD